jgi:hypothetical protein
VIPPVLRRAERCRFTDGLNVLLSFAQFEREVTSERIRDKIAASKRKGLWVGGIVPLGYATKDRKIVVVEEEAKRVRTIFRRYLDLGSLNRLMADLRERGIVTKLRLLKNLGFVYLVQPPFDVLKPAIIRSFIVLAAVWLQTLVHRIRNRRRLLRFGHRSSLSIQSLARACFGMGSSLNYFLPEAGSFHAPICAKLAITLSRKDWHSPANRAVV